MYEAHTVTHMFNIISSLTKFFILYKHKRINTIKANIYYMSQKMGKGNFWTYKTAKAQFRLSQL